MNSPYEDPKVIPKRAGIYIVISISKLSNGNFSVPTYEILNIGQSESLG